MNKVNRKRPRGQSYGRMLNHGMDPSDFLKLIERTEYDYKTNKAVEKPEDFVDVTSLLGDENYSAAELALSKGYSVTAGKYYLNASALYRVADYALVAQTEEKISLYKKLVDSYKKGKALSTSDKPIYVEIPFEHATMPGLLTIPENASSDVPVVIVIPGATGYKEENYPAARKLWERGVATLIFDGPGQGEAMMFRGYTLTVDNYEKAVKAVIDFIKEDDRVGNDIALYGISYGGYLAPRAACFLSDEIKACAARGGCAKTDDLIYPLEKGFLKKFMLKIRETDEEKAKELCKEMHIEDDLKNLTTPLLVAHSIVDRVVGEEGAKFIYDAAQSEDKELYISPSHDHCSDDIDEEVGSYIADWLIERLVK